MASRSNESGIQLALQAIRINPELSARAAATIYSVSHATLSRRLKGSTSRSDRVPNSRNLTLLEEQTLVDHIADLQ
ncbi:hypothetical protein LZ31DRAFT_485796 [Colletotrichum somersetense]|nr:hypothetical protein LZ31DRAFT_485796 [Colletotrichum somersetense]